MTSTLPLAYFVVIQHKRPPRTLSRPPPCLSSATRGHRRRQAGRTAGETGHLDADLEPVGKVAAPEDGPQIGYVLHAECCFGDNNLHRFRN